MLLNDFYTITHWQAGAQMLRCRVRFNPAHAIFKGHFPGQPVVPGVCMIQLFKELLEQQLGKPCLLQHAGQVKFRQLLTPETEPQADLSWQATPEGYAIQAVLKNDVTLLFQLTGICVPREGHTHGV
jgi:3-hydroxyacyl-[acyl-carrier-protein] dehydratase